MLGMKGMVIVGGLGAIACLLLAFLWKSEQSDHEYTKRLLDAETRRANMATEAANNNAAKVAELEQDMVREAARQQYREQENNRILAEKNEELLKVRNRMGAWKDAIEKRPKVAERAMRAELNRRLRELAAITCRTDCARADSPKDNKPATPP